MINFSSVHQVSWSNLLLRRVLLKFPFTFQLKSRYVFLYHSIVHNLLICYSAQPYYDYFNHQIYRSTSKGKNVAISAGLHQIPLLIRGGSIVPTRERPRRSSPLMKKDPFTLRIALDKSSNARGELYIDDGVSYNHEQGQIVWREFKAAKPARESRSPATISPKPSPPKPLMESL